MNESINPAILIVGHGSPRKEANDGFLRLAERITLRLGRPVLPTFFSLARPNIEDQVARLAAQGVTRVLLMPYFLYTGQHVSKDIPALLADCRSRFPQVVIEMLPTLEGESTLEEIIIERLLAHAGSANPLPTQGPAIERRSHEIIQGLLDAGAGASGNQQEQAVVRRVVHATADLSFARSLRIHPEAIAAGQAALAKRSPILCDVRMLQAGITRSASEVLCAIDDPRTMDLAKKKGCTRAAAAMELLQDRLAGAVVAIGNAPTALWKILEIAAQGGPKPALVVGLPVGFVGARESKQALMESTLCYVTNIGPRGGSPVAAAAVNAIARIGKESADE